MKAKFEEILWEKFPLLYADRNESLKRSLMGFGFECDDGWYKIIYELSEKLEKEIEQYIKDNPKLECYSCGCEKDKHLRMVGCTNTLVFPRRIKYYRSSYKTSKWRKTINKFINKVSPFLNKILFYLPGKKVPCRCKAYSPSHPRAIQVKEKYGTLRFYLSHETDKMERLISEAESKTSTTCESCGSEGEVRNDGWVATRCDECYEEGRKDFGEGEGDV